VQSLGFRTLFDLANYRNSGSSAPKWIRHPRWSATLIEAVKLGSRSLYCIFRLLACSAMGGMGWQPCEGSEAGFPIVNTFSCVDISASAPVWKTVQDGAGKLYFGSMSLETFDGDHWRRWAVPNGRTFRALEFGVDGRLWIGGTGELGWFTRGDGLEQNFVSLNHRLPPEAQSLGEMFHVFADGPGAIFVCEDKVLRWDGTQFAVWSMPGSRHLRGFRADGKIFIQHRPTGVYEMRAAGPELVIPASIIGTAGIYWAESVARGGLFITGQGAVIFREGSARAVWPEASRRFARDSITSAIRLPDGRFAIGTLEGGVLLLSADGSIEQVFTKRDGLPTDAVESLFLDRDGLLWATSPSHVFNLAIASPSTLFDARTGAPDLPVFCVDASADQVVVASSQGVYQLRRGERSFTQMKGVPGRAYDVRNSPLGVLVGGFHSAMRVRNDEVQEIYHTEKDVFQIAPRVKERESVLLADGREIVALDAEGRKHVLVRDIPEPPRSLAEDETGTVWIGTVAHGILSAPTAPAGPADATPVRLPGGHSSMGEGVVIGGSDGTVVLLTQSGGWVHLPGRDRLEVIRGLPGREIGTASVVGRDGLAWLIHPSATGRAAMIARLSVRPGASVWEPYSVEGLSSIGEPLSISVEHAPGGDILWIGGTKGVLRHVVQTASALPQPPKPLLYALTRSESDSAARTITAPLAYSTPSIWFEFAEPDFLRRPLLRLETRLDGVDRDWVPADATSRREFTALRDGDYTFRVRAVAETGIASEAAVFDFKVLPPWWRTAPAMLGLALAFLPLGYGVHQIRIRTLRRRNAALEAKVRQRTEQLEQANAAKTEFVANMSHDIRNPLNGIVGLALALEDTRLDARQREIVTTLRDCTTYLSTLVDDVLDFASIEAGRVEIRPAPFAPAELLRAIATTLQAEAAQCGARLSIEVDPALPGILLGDAGRIQQILVNYVSNALKYAGGDILLSAKTVPGTADEVDFSVTDAGPGISEAEQATLFTKFTRLAPARRDGIPGAGLGLAACRLLADIMDGSVGVESRPGHGARFLLRLPLVETQAVAAPELGELPNTAVLLVEDADYNALAAEAVLRRLGLRCDRARDGAGALELFRARRYNLVLLDRNLPDMDGTEIARRIRESEVDGSHAIILAVTAYCTAGDRQLCIDAGMDAFVGKPLTPEKLRRVLREASRQLLSAATYDAAPAESTARTTPATSGQPLDLTLIEYLADKTDDGLAKQVGSYVDGLCQVELHLGTAIAAGDFTQLALSAHQLCGHARLIGADALAAAARQLEAAGRSGDAATCSEAFRAVREEGERVKAALRRPDPGALTT
jgi:signal transduction histidine kinase/DNA-binding NarL/FixJ family response regulator/HPt (histidine-containing phosphotransfer) domain-containing protein